VAREARPILTFVLGNREFLDPMHGRMLQGAERYCEEIGYFLVSKRLGYSAATPVGELTLPSLLREHGIADCLILAGAKDLSRNNRSTRRPPLPYGRGSECASEPRP
jgi:hypothetical protein